MPENPEWNAIQKFFYHAERWTFEADPWPDLVHGSNAGQCELWDELLKDTNGFDSMRRF